MTGRTKGLKLGFWASAGLIVYAHAGYFGLLWLLTRGRAAADHQEPREEELPSVSLIVTAHDEEAVIAAKVENALALDYPRERLEVIVASDGSGDATVERARAASADVVLDLPRAGKQAAQDAAAARARGDVLALSDANSLWAPDALRRLVAPLADPRVGYVCGQVSFAPAEGGTNQEGLYWRYELALRDMESRLAGVTAGNGAIHATRAALYFDVDPLRGDLSFPFRMVKRGYLALYVAEAVAEEKMVPSIEGEFRRKRRMMSRAWGTVLGAGMLSPRGYPPLYALEIASHRVLRYATPFLHVGLFCTNLGLVRRGRVYGLALVVQAALLAAAVAAPRAPLRVLRVPYYYVVVTASIAAGLWDFVRGGSPLVWEKAEGTR